MNRTEHLFTIAGEEAVEVAKCVSKLLRFGPDDKEPGQPRTNAQRIMDEFMDLSAMIEWLQDKGKLPKMSAAIYLKHRVDKVVKVEKFFAISRENGTLIE